MDFELTETQKDFQQSITKFLKIELAPKVKEIESAHEFPISFYKKLAENRLLGINFPQKYGGRSADSITCALLIEELSKYSSSVAGSVTTSGMTGPYLLLVSGSEAQKEKYLHGVPTGETITAFAITEPDAGSDVSNLSTHAKREGDFYRINGTKVFITNGSVATIFLVVATTDDQGKEFSVFLIEKGTPGLTVSKKFEKLGWAAQDTTEVVLNDVIVPKENIIGKEGQGLLNAFHSINFTRILLAATALGVSEAALDLVVEYAKNKHRDGGPLIRQQAMRAEFAKMAMEIEAARLLIYRAATMQDKKVRNRKECAMAKRYATEMAKHIAKEALRIHGKDAFITQHQAAVFFCDTPVFTIADGTSEIQLENISRELGYLKPGQMGD